MIRTYVNVLCKLLLVVLTTSVHKNVYTNTIERSYFVVLLSTDDDNIDAVDPVPASDHLPPIQQALSNPPDQEEHILSQPHGDNCLVIYYGCANNLEYYSFLKPSTSVLLGRTS